MTPKEWILSNWDRILERANVQVQAIDKSTCRYRVDRDGYNLSPENCCFIGYLIPPDVYDNSANIHIETKSPSSVFSLIHPDDPYPEDEDIQILKELQKIHDVLSCAHWSHYLSEFKEKYLT